MNDGVQANPTKRDGAPARRCIGLALLAGVSAAALAAPAFAQGSTGFSDQTVNFANAVNSALHGSSSIETAYSYEYATRTNDDRPYINLDSNFGTVQSITDCSGWVNYTMNSVAPIHHALATNHRLSPVFNDASKGLNESAQPWARAMVLQSYFDTMPDVSSGDTGKGFQQITDFSDTSGTTGLRGGDIVAYCEGEWCDPRASRGDTGHTFVVTGTPTIVVASGAGGAEANYSEFGGASGKFTGPDNSLGDLASDPSLTVLAIPVVDSSTLRHFSNAGNRDLRSYGAGDIPSDLPSHLKSGEVSAGGLGAGFIFIAVDAEGVIHQTRFSNGDNWLPYQSASSSSQKAAKRFGAVRLTDSIALSEVLTVTKWSNTVDSFGGHIQFGALPVDISGSSGGIRLEGGGTLHLTGSNSYGAGTTVTDGSTLIVLADGSLGASSSDLTLDDGSFQVTDGFTSTGRKLVLGAGGGTLQTIGTTGTVSWSGDIGGSGDLRIGRGDWTFDGTGSSYSGTVTIARDAQLSVAAGTALGGAAIVSHGGTLAGGGQVGHLTNHGIVAPGSSNTLNTAGAYTQTSGGTLTIGLASAAQHAKLVAAGAAHLAGRLVAEPVGGYVPEVDASFTIIEATNIDGTFSTVDATFSPTLTGEVSYGTRSVTLKASRDYNNDKLHDRLKDRDLRGVAKALNERAHVRTGATHSALSAIDRLTRSNDAGEALHQLKPHNPTHHATTSIKTSKGHSSRVSSRLNALRNASVDTGGDAPSGLSAGDAAAGIGSGHPVAAAVGSGGGAVAGTLFQLAADPDQIDPGRMVPVGVMDAGQTALTAGRSIGVFAYGTGILGYQDTTSEREGYRFEGGGLTVGMDYRVSDRLVVGLAGSYAETRTKYQGGADISDADTWSAGPYAMFTDGPFYLEAVGSYSWTVYDNTRTVNLGTFTAVSNSNPDGRQYSLYAGSGYDFAIAPGTTLGPTAALQYTHGDVDGYTETGSNPFNLTVGSQSMNSLQSSLGARLRGTYEGGWGRVLPEIRVSWSHEFDNDATTVTSQLSGGTIPFTTTGDDPVRDWVNLGAEVALELTAGTSLFASTDAQMAFNRENAAISASAGVRVAF